MDETEEKSIEEQYASWKAPETGFQSEELETSSIKEIPKDDPRYKEYFDGLSSKNNILVYNILSSPLNIKHLYESQSKEGPRLNHVFWIGSQGDYHSPISMDQLSYLRAQPELVSKTDTMLLDCYNRALNFYDWQTKTRGFVIEGSQGFGLEEGTVTGVRVSYPVEIAPLSKALEAGDEQEIARRLTHIGASMVHELAHRNESEPTFALGGGDVERELPSHVAQFLFDPKNNEILNKQLGDSIFQIRRARSGEFDPRKLSHYDKAQYFTLLLVAARLSSRNEAIKALLTEDQSEDKQESLIKVGDTISPEDIEYLKKTLLTELLETDTKGKKAIVDSAEKDLGIIQSVNQLG